MRPRSSWRPSFSRAPSAAVDEARKLTDRFIKLYGRKLRLQSAEVAFAAIAGPRDESPESRDRAIAEIQRYIKRFGRVGGAGRLVAAYARLGELLWQKSCKTGADRDGVCTAIRSPKSPPRIGRPRRCGQAETHRVVLRDRKLAERARKATDERGANPWQIAATRPNESE